MGQYLRFGHIVMPSKGLRRDELLRERPGRALSCFCPALSFRRCWYGQQLLDQVLKLLDALLQCSNTLLHLCLDMSRHLFSKRMLCCSLDMSRQEPIQVTDSNLTAIWERIAGWKGACTDRPLDGFRVHATASSRFLDGDRHALTFVFPAVIFFVSGQCVQVRGSSSGPRHGLMPSFSRVSAASARSRHVNTSSC